MDPDAPGFSVLAGDCAGWVGLWAIAMPDPIVSAATAAATIKLFFLIRYLLWVPRRGSPFDQRGNNAE